MSTNLQRRLRELISAWKNCRRWNRGDLRLAEVNPNIGKVLELTGLNTPVHDLRHRSRGRRQLLTVAVGCEAGGWKLDDHVDLQLPFVSVSRDTWRNVSIAIAQADVFGSNDRPAGYPGLCRGGVQARRCDSGICSSTCSWPSRKRAATSSSTPTRARAASIHLAFEHRRTATSIITLRDQGRPFDPQSVTRPDLALPLNERPIGGLGLSSDAPADGRVRFSFARLRQHPGDGQARRIASIRRDRATERSDAMAEPEHGRGPAHGCRARQRRKAAVAAPPDTSWRPWPRSAARSCRRSWMKMSSAS